MKHFITPVLWQRTKKKQRFLFKAIESLPEKQKLAFTLIKVQGMNYEETCEVMQQNIKAVESLISRAKVNLQKQLENYYKTLK